MITQAFFALSYGTDLLVCPNRQGTLVLPNTRIFSGELCGPITERARPVLNALCSIIYGPDGCVVHKVDEYEDLWEGQPAIHEIFRFKRPTLYPETLRNGAVLRFPDTTGREHFHVSVVRAARLLGLSTIPVARVA